MSKPKTAVENQYLKALRCQMLDTSLEARLERLTRLAKQLFSVPTALISLVDGERHCFTSKQSFETSSNILFCGHTLLSNDILYVPDTSTDERFADNPLVTSIPNIRFYAGAPLSTPEGSHIGTLCIIDQQPRSMSQEQLYRLRDLADCVQEELHRASTLFDITRDCDDEWFAQDRFDAEHQRHHQLLNAISRAQSQFIKDVDSNTGDNADNNKVFDDLLSDILQLTDSEYGFIGEIMHTDENQPYLKTRAITSVSWNEETRSFYQEHAPPGMEFFNLSTLFGATITSGEAVIANTPSQDPRRGSLPHGHPPLNTYLGVPFYSGDKFVGMAGLANRSQGYDKQLVEFLQPLLTTCANLIDAQRQSVRRHDAEEELNRFKHVLDNTLDMIFMFDADTLKFNYLNRGAVNSMGYSRDELLQMTPYHIKPLMTQAGFRELIAPLLTGKKSALHFETLHRRKNGSDFPVEIFLQLVKESENQQRFVAIVRDISERKRTELETKQYTSALEQLHTITTDTNQDLQQKIHALLELGRRVFELPLAIVSCIEGNQYTVKYISGPSDAPPPGTVFELGQTYCSHTLQADKPLGFHHAGTSEISDHPCYHSFKLESYIGTPLFVAGKRYGTLNFSGTDPKARPFNHMQYSLIQIFAQWVGNELAQYRINQKLHDVTALRQAILDSANASIISTDVDGTIQTFNKGAERMLGYSAEEVVGKTSPALIHDSDEVIQRAVELSDELGYTIEPGFEVFVAKARRGAADEREWTYIRKDGTRFPVLLSVTPVYDSKGNVQGFLGVGTDLTERKKIDRMKSEFVSTVSHELRTPLTSIRGALGILLGKADQNMSEQSQKLLEMASRNSERLTLLINDILDLEKIESGRLEFQFALIDLVSITKNALEANIGYAQQHNVTLRLDDSLTEAMVWGDSHRLLQVFANLISNAVKFSPAGETVCIGVTIYKNFYRVSVSDHGSGIPDEFRSRIFQRFAQADGSDTREKGGTGLGLSICKAIVEKHHGYIHYQSSPGSGTVFYFELPRWQAQSQQQAMGD